MAINTRDRELEDEAAMVARATQNADYDIQDSDPGDISWRDPATIGPTISNAQPIFQQSPVAPRPLNSNITAPAYNSPGTPDYSSTRPNAARFSPLRGADGDINPDTNRLLASLAANCTETTGSCLRSVANAFASVGFDMRAAIDNARNMGWAPRHPGSYWANDMIPVLDHDNRFSRVATGFGARTNEQFVPRVGDIAVWRGGTTGPYGHIQVCIGFDAQGNARWRSDFTTSAQNWTGMRDPNAHGGEFVIYRRNTDNNPVVANNQPQPNVNAPRTDGPAAATDPRTVMFHIADGVVTINGHVYRAGSGNREGFNNPSLAGVQNRGPVSLGEHTLSPHGQFWGDDSWLVGQTPGRDGILIHSAGIHLRGRPEYESLGCLTIDPRQWENFKRDMAAVGANRLVVTQDPYTGAAPTNQAIAQNTPPRTQPLPGVIDAPRPPLG